jgi:hypothetical protein
MLKYISKFAMDILPSLAATIIGAYIVNHYIVAKPGPDAPVAALASPAEPKKAEAKTNPKLSETSSDVSNLPEPGVKAKGVSEKAVLDKSAVEAGAPKAADKPTETASIPLEPRRHPPTPREKTAARTTTVAPVVAAPASAPPVEAATAPDEHRDANDLARAAIERLRVTGESSPRALEADRIPDPARVAAAPPLSAPPGLAPAIRQLPPPITVATPAAEPLGSVSGSTKAGPPYRDDAGMDDPRRPTPPSDIPPPPPLPPLVLHAEATGPSMRENTSVAEGMLAAARSVFHAVLPK